LTIETAALYEIFKIDASIIYAHDRNNKITNQRYKKAIITNVIINFF